MAEDTGVDYGQVGVGLAGTLLGGPVGGMVAGGLYNAVTGLFSNRDANGLNPNTPKFSNPADLERRLTAEQLLHSNTGDEFAAHQHALHQNSARDTMDRLSRDLGGNPAATADIYNKVNRDAESADVGTNLQGAQMRTSDQKAGLGELNDLSSENSANWHDYVSRASKPTTFETVMGDAFAKTAGGIAGGAGKIGTDLVMKGLNLGDGTGGGKKSGGSGGTSGTDTGDNIGGEDEDYG